MKIEKGSIINLNKESDKLYIVIEDLKKEDKIYYLITDFFGDVTKEEVDEVTIDYSKIFMVEYDDKTEEFNVNTDREIIMEIVEKSFSTKDD